MCDITKTSGAILKNENGQLAIALAPHCTATVTHVEIDQYSGAFRLLFDKQELPIEVGHIPTSFDRAAIVAQDILIAHFDNRADFENFETSREYRVPIL